MPKKARPVSVSGYTANRITDHGREEAFQKRQAELFRLEEMGVMSQADAIGEIGKAYEEEQDRQDRSKLRGEDFIEGDPTGNLFAEDDMIIDEEHPDLVGKGYRGIMADITDDQEEAIGWLRNQIDPNYDLHPSPLGKKIGDTFDVIGTNEGPIFMRRKGTKTFFTSDPKLDAFTFAKQRVFKAGAHEDKAAWGEAIDETKKDIFEDNDRLVKELALAIPAEGAAGSAAVAAGASPVGALGAAGLTAAAIGGGMEVGRQVERGKYGLPQSAAAPVGAGLLSGLGAIIGGSTVLPKFFGGGKNISKEVAAQAQSRGNKIFGAEVQEIPGLTGAVKNWTLKKGAALASLFARSGGATQRGANALIDRRKEVKALLNPDTLTQKIGQIHGDMQKAFQTTRGVLGDNLAQSLKESPSQVKLTGFKKQALEIEQELLDIERSGLGSEGQKVLDQFRNTLRNVANPVKQASPGAVKEAEFLLSSIPDDVPAATAHMLAQDIVSKADIWTARLQDIGVNIQEVGPRFQNLAVKMVELGKTARKAVDDDVVIAARQDYKVFKDVERSLNKRFFDEDATVKTLEDMVEGKDSNLPGLLNIAEKLTGAPINAHADLMMAHKMFVKARTLDASAGTSLVTSGAIAAATMSGGGSGAVMSAGFLAGAVGGLAAFSPSGMRRGIGLAQRTGRPGFFSGEGVGAISKGVGSAAALPTLIGVQAGQRTLTQETARRLGIKEPGAFDTEENQIQLRQGIGRVARQGAEVAVATTERAVKTGPAQGFGGFLTREMSKEQRETLEKMPRLGGR